MYQPGDPELSKLDPEFERWLHDNPLPPITEEALREISKARQTGVKADIFKIDRPSTEDSEIQQQDLDIPTRDGTTRIRIYRPRAYVDTNKTGPLIVIFHAGGFCIGDYTMVDNGAYTFCKRFGATCVSVDYRLAPEHPFPAAAHDAWDSLQWVAGLDPVRDNALIYERELREECGIATKIDLYPGQVHGFWMVAPGLSVSLRYKEDMWNGVEWLLSRV